MFCDGRNAQQNLTFAAEQGNDARDAESRWTRGLENPHPAALILVSVIWQQALSVKTITAGGYRIQH